MTTAKTTFTNIECRNLQLIKFPVILFVYTLLLSRTRTQHFFSGWQCSKNCFFQKRYTRIPNTYQVCFMSFSYWWNINIQAWNILFLHAKSIFFYDTYNLGLQVVFLLAKKTFGAPKWSRCQESPKICGDFLKMSFWGICLFLTEI